MTLTIAPIPANTSSGAPLPLVALPQSSLLTVNENNIPQLTDVLGPGVHAKPLRLDLEAGCWVVLAIFSPGSKVPLHYHTGIAEVYTLIGSLGRVSGHEDRALFLAGLPPGDAWVLPSFDDLRKSGAPGGRSCVWVMRCRCPSIAQG
jgi:hypothetical protein